MSRNTIENSKTVSSKKRDGIFAPSSLFGYFMMLPAMSVLVFFFAYPLTFEVWTSLTDKTLGNDAKFVGIDNYIALFSDPEFMKVLPTLQIPFLTKDRKHRAFPISGDSMPPVNNGSHVIGEFLQDWTQLKSGTPCIVVTKEDGIVFKFVYNHLEENQSLLLVSSNPLFEPYTVKMKDIIEIWKFSAYFSKDLPEVQMDALQLSLSYRNLHKDIQRILDKIKS